MPGRRAAPVRSARERRQPGADQDRALPGDPPDRPGQDAGRRLAGPLRGARGDRGRGGVPRRPGGAVRQWPGPARGRRPNPVPGLMSLFDLTGRRALVTGSSQGIGFALARGLADAGATVVLNGRDAEKLAAAALQIPGAEQAEFDVTDHAEVAAMIDAIEDDEPIDILVNNAGLQHRAPLE